MTPKALGQQQRYLVQGRDEMTVAELGIKIDPIDTK